MDVQDFSVEIPAVQLRYHTANLGAESSLSPTYQECEPMTVNQQSPPGGNRSCVVDVSVVLWLFVRIFRCLFRNQTVARAAG